MMEDKMSTYVESSNISPVACCICLTLPPEASRQLLNVCRPAFAFNKEVGGTKTWKIEEAINPF